ncbi:hypothetical protein ABZ707_13210 [Streptomyces sp. NPDC006923]|uniref:hypothetical protein n=1 Tax=Streptomyces sp. NPDC006923 TaxID=3155355 RepID=UPI0034084FEA
MFVPRRRRRGWAGSRIAAAKLKYCGLEALTDMVMLLVSELLTNAMVHSGTTEIDLRLVVRT